MAKKSRPRAGQMTKDEVEKIAESIVQQKEKIPVKKANSRPFNIRIPVVIFERLDDISKKTGLSKSAIILGGVNAELDRLEK